MSKMQTKVLSSLVFLKISIFLLNGAWNSYLQYLGLHAKYIGITLEELTLISSFLPMAACSGPPITGLLADKVVSSKVVLMISASVCAATHLCLLAVDTRMNVYSVTVDGSAESDCSAQVSMPGLQEKRRWSFVCYFALRLVGAFTHQGAISLLDSITITMTKKYDAGIGKQKILAVLSQATFSFGSSGLMKWTETNQGYTDYSYIFYLEGGLTLLSVPFLFFLEDDRKDDGVIFTKNALLIFKQSRVVLFTFMVFSFGACWGFHSAFYQLYLVDIEANSILLGLSVAIGCVTAVPFLFFSDPLVKKFGPTFIFAGALLLYSVRFTGYSLIQNPWLCLIFDSLVTQSLASVAANYFSESVSNPGTVATVNGIFNAVLYGLGKSAGSATGGSLVIRFGYGISYAFYALFSFTMALGYFTYNFLHARCSKREKPGMSEN